MLIQVHRKLGAVNSDVEGWLDQVREHVEHGTNFLLILRKDPLALKKFCNSFQLEDDCHPRILSQGEFFLMSQHVKPARMTPCCTIGMTIIRSYSSSKSISR